MKLIVMAKGAGDNCFDLEPLPSQQPPHPAARGHHNSIPLASTSRKKSLKSFKNVTYDMPPMTSTGAESKFGRHSFF